MKKSRNGKYKEYEKRVLQFLVEQKDDVSAFGIRNKLKIPRSSLYDVLGTLRDSGHIGWIGEPQDFISMILITDSGKEYLTSLMS